MRRLLQRAAARRGFQLEAVAAASTTASTTTIACRPLSSSSTLLQRLRPPAPAVTLASARQHQQQPLQPLVRGFSSSGKGGEGESSEPAERDIKQPSMDVEKDVAVALRGVQELHRAGKYKEALEASMGMRDWLERELGEDHPVYASCLNNIALFYKLTNEFEEAVHWYSQALHKYKHTVGEKHRSYAATLNNLGLVFLAQAQQAEAQGKGRMQTMGHLDSAESTLREALRIREEILDESDAALANTRSNLASVLQRTGRAGEAEELLRTSLARVVEKHGFDSAEAALCLTNLSFLLKGEGRLEEALGFAKDALAARRAVHKGQEDHPAVIIALNNLAECHRAKGEEDEAVRLQNEILRVLGVPPGGGGEEGQGGAKP